MLSKWLFVLIMALPVHVFADGELWRIDEDDETEQLSGTGTWVDPYTLPPVVVVETRPEPERLGHMVRTGGTPRYIWNSDDNWWIYDEGEWEEMDEPSLMITASGDLLSGNFITSDHDHYMLAETDDINRLEWRAEGHNTGSGTILFAGSGSQTGITFDPLTETLRTYLIGYTVTGRIGSVESSATFEQDDVSQLRQEYVDKRQIDTPEFHEFDADVPHDPKLADPTEVHSYHDYHIVTFINEKAVALESYYPHTFYYTAGYVCPGRNTKHARESQHIYGKAFDFDAGSNDDPNNSRKNFDIYWVGRDSIGATYSALYDARNTPFEDIPENYTDPKPPGFVGDIYRHGHLDWR